MAAGHGAAQPARRRSWQARIDAIDGGKVLNRQHIFRRARRHHAALVHQHDPVTEARGERQVVQRDDHRAPLGREPGEVLEQRQLVRRVETGRGLVGEQDGGLLRERARDQHAGAFAARHLDHRARREMGHVHGRERCRDGARVGRALARAGRLVRQATERDHGARRQRPVDDAVLRQVGERARERLAMPVGQGTRAGEHRSRDRRQQAARARAAGSTCRRRWGR